MNIWPKVNDAEGAVDAAHWAAGICFFVSVVTSFASAMALISGHPVLGIDGIGLLDSALFAFLGWRIWKLSRFAAVAALLLYCFEISYRLSATASLPSPILMVLLILGLTHGIRGAFLLEIHL